MKGVTGRQRLNVRRDGFKFTLADITSPPYSTSVKRFEKVFSEADQRVFVPLRERCNKEQAYLLKDKEFIEWTRQRLVEVAKGFWKDIPEDTSYAVVYNRICDFLRDRDEKINAYRG